MLKIEHLHQSYGTVPVLQDFSWELEPGEVHALLGSNGAGKSTLARVITGLTPFQEGALHWQGGAFQPNSRSDAEDAGIVMVLQELNIIPTLSVAENLYIDRLPRKLGFIDYSLLEKNSRTALTRVHLDEIDSSKPASNLGVGQQQLVEIARALDRNVKLLILDEPTAALTGPEIEQLFEEVHKLKRSGVSVIYITHRMEEIEALADRVTVLRDGRCQSTHEVGKITREELITEMAGRNSELVQRKTLEQPKGEVGLSVNGILGIDFQAFKGEILGIAGLVGAGRTELLRAIYGADPIQSGTITIDETKTFEPSSPGQSLKNGIALIPEDRKQQALLLPISISENITLNTLDQHSSLGFINENSCREITNSRASDLGLVYQDSGQTVAELSGGNQQKVVIARALETGAEVYLFDEPTRGVDVAARQNIYQSITELADGNKTMVIVSSDFEELMQICDRILVLSNGSLTGEFTPETWSSENLTAAAFAGFERRDK